MPRTETTVTFNEASTAESKKRAGLRGLPRRAGPSWSRRGVAIAALCLAPVAGAAAGAASHPVRFTAEAIVVADSSSTLQGTGNLLSLPAPPQERLQRFSEVLLLRQVARAVQESTRIEGDLRDRMTLEGSPARGLLRIVVRDESPDPAKTLADAFGQQSLNFINSLEALNGADLPIGDFETTALDNWGAITPRFSLPPNRLSRSTSAARFNSASLEVECPASAGCGPTVRLYYPFSAAVPYTAQGWAKTRDRRTPVAMVLGATSDDLGGGTPLRLRRSWRRFTVTWTPKEDHDFAELTFQTAADRATTFNVDGVSLANPSGASAGDGAGLSRASETLLFERGPYVTISAARNTGALEEKTAVWALIGGGLGFLVALAGVGLGAVAARRREQRAE